LNIKNIKSYNIFLFWLLQEKTVFFPGMATVLKRGHSLKGKSHMPLIRRIRAIQWPPNDGRMARTARDLATEDLTQV
jgi:hypothetical protein